MGGSKDEALKKMMKLTNSLMSRSDAAPFREPVDWRGLELFDYPKIIKKMMDLGTVKRKMERKQYSNAAECAEDIRLVWVNCKTYNMEGSDFFLIANNFSRKFEERYKKICNEYDVGEADGAASAGGASSKSSASGSGGAKSTGPISLDNKVLLASKIFRLSGMELARAMNIIEQRCPQALESCGDGNSSTEDENGVRLDEVEINIDSLDNRTFNELNQLLVDTLSNGGRNVVERSRNGTSSTKSSRPPSSEEEEEEEEYEEVEVDEDDDDEEAEFEDDLEEAEVVIKHSTKKRRRSKD